MSTGTIQGSFGWDNAPFVQGMAEAERVATRGAGNIQSKFTSIFKRGPNVRAERAFSGLFERVAAGDIAGGIEQISSRMTGLGLIAGVAVAAGVAIFVKFKQEIQAATAAQIVLENELSKPLALEMGLSAEGIAQQLAAVEAARKDLVEKSKTFGSRFKEQTRPAAAQEILQSKIQQFTEHNLRPPTDKEIEEMSGTIKKSLGKTIHEDLLGGRKRIEGLEKAAADHAEKTVAIRAQGLKISEYESELAKITLTANEKVAALRLAGRHQAGFAREEAMISQIHSVRKDEQLSKDVAADREKIRRLETASALDLASITASNLAQDKQHILILREQLDLINKMAASKTNLTGPEKEVFAAQKAGKVSELGKTLYDQAKADALLTPEQRQAKLDQAGADKKDYDFFLSHGHIKGQGQYDWQSDQQPFGLNQKPIAKPFQADDKDTALLGEVQKLNTKFDAMVKAWATQ